MTSINELYVEILIKILYLLDTKEKEELYKINFFKKIINKDDKLKEEVNSLYILCISYGSFEYISTDVYYYNNYYEVKNIFKKKCINNMIEFIKYNNEIDDDDDNNFEGINVLDFYNDFDDKYFWSIVDLINHYGNDISIDYNFDFLFCKCCDNIFNAKISVFNKDKLNQSL